ncbi:MAG: Trp family transcriptional regulator [bacterium]|nr:Trp family transcriptional regulator [bacterium]
MSNTSKKYFEEDFKKKIWEEAIKEISRAKSEKEIIKTLSRALTPSELNLLEKRLIVVYLLKQGFTYRKICEIADVHYNTVSFVKKGLKKPIRKKKVWSEFGSSNKREPRFSKWPKYKGV